jgi:putative membrane protein
VLRLGRLLERHLHVDRDVVQLAARAAIGVVAALHLAFLIMESVLWQRPSVRRRFGMSADEAKLTAPLAMNQGLYNGFLAAGLVWALLAAPPLARPLALFFLGCVVVAGIFGGITARRQILFLQALPGAVALALAWSAL